MTKLKRMKLSLLILTSIFLSGHLSAAPEWSLKPVQCGPLQEIFDRIDNQGLQLLMTMTGNARIGENQYSLPYGMYYNPETGFWTFLEIQGDGETGCVVGVGQGIDFDVPAPKTI